MSSDAMHFLQDALDPSTTLTTTRVRDGGGMFTAGAIPAKLHGFRAEDHVAATA